MKYLMFLSMALVQACGSSTPSDNTPLSSSGPNVSPSSTPALLTSATLNPNTPTGAYSYGGYCAANIAIGTWANQQDSTDQVTFHADCTITSTKCGTVMSFAGDSWEQTSTHITSWVFDFGTDSTECHPTFDGPYTSNTRTVVFQRNTNNHNIATISYRNTPFGYTSLYNKVN